MPTDSTAPSESATGLERGLGLWQATSLNIANMVGVGPFITIPIFISKLPGPQALIGWVIAAVLVICDGLVWSELGAALPGSGGSYHFLRVIFGGYRWGRILPFLFIWQFLISGALELASGYIGAIQYFEYVFPSLSSSLASWEIVGGTRWFAVLCVVLVTAMLCQRIHRIGWLSIVLCAGTIITVSIVIVAGLANFDRRLLVLPPDALTVNKDFAMGLGAAMLIAVYDYLGYYNVCHLGDEVRQPARTIPRAVIISVVAVAAIYLTMNLSIIAVVPWQKAQLSTNIAADFMETLYGRPIAVAFTFLILWTSLACVFAMTLGYSRIPYAAARQGDFFRAFGHLHPKGHFPTLSLFVLGVLTSMFCFLELKLVIDAAVCVRIAIQFIGQIVALHWVHTRRPDIVLPFRMWLYPIPSLIALVGWIFVLATSEWIVLVTCLAVIGSGVIVFIVWRSLIPVDRNLKS